MATIAPTVTEIGYGNFAAKQAIWTPVTSADTCGAVTFPEYSEKSIQVAGTFDSASVAVNGSNDGTNYVALNDPGGTVIAVTSAKIKGVLEKTMFVQPVATSGGGSQSLTISMFFLATNPLRS